MVNVVADRLSRVEVDLVKSKQSGITKTGPICSQTLHREFVGLVCAAESGVCRSLQEFAGVCLQFSLEILCEASDS